MGDSCDIVRFQNKISKSTECWEWTAFKVRGYGRFSFGGKTYQAHRIAAFFDGMLPSLDSDLQVLHRCDNPSCVRPSHLFLGSHADNMADKTAKGRQSKGASHGTAKLSIEDVREIRRVQNSCYELARRYNVSPSHIAKIKRGELWTI